MNLDGTRIWQTNCVTSGVYQDGIDYVQDHAKHGLHFSFAEILLMTAMNEIEVKRKASATVSNPERTRSGQ